MNKIVLIIFSVICFWSASSTFANSNGEIGIHGAVIEAPFCLPRQKNSLVQLDCTINNNNLSKSDIVFNSQLEYLDQEKNKAVMQVIYN